ncbi:MAG: metalloregulator ArsR/SmtB family transcription factor [Deltaproteobacteria bacterium]
MSGDNVAFAPVFAALGDVTRLELLARMGSGEPLSIARLSDGLNLTRQGVTKHLDVLESAQLVSREKVGRESLYQVRPDGVRCAQDYLARASAQWDAAVDRLKALVED